MNIIVLPPQAEGKPWCITDQRQLNHLHGVLQVQAGDTLKVGIQGQGRYLTRIISSDAQGVAVEPLQEEPVPAKLPVTLIVALPRPKVLRRLVSDAVALGVQKLVLIHSYRVDKSYWQSPFLQQLGEYVQLGLEQSGDVHAPVIELYRRFKPFVEDHLAEWSCQQPSFVGHPSAERPAPVALNQPCQLIIGPEGGFIPYEIELMQRNGVQPVTMGARILRTETAIPVMLGRLFTQV